MNILTNQGHVQTENRRFFVETPETQPAADDFVPLAYWLKHRNTQAVWVDGGVDFEVLKGILPSITALAIHFPAFKDGRGYSVARILRTRLGYTGPLYALGDVLQDQVYYLSRCGFDRFAIRADRDIHAAAAALTSFNVRYQNVVDAATPVPEGA